LIQRYAFYDIDRIRIGDALAFTLAKRREPKKAIAKKFRSTSSLK
jgi:hypothetical protein